MCAWMRMFILKIYKCKKPRKNWNKKENIPLKKSFLDRDFISKQHAERKTVFQLRKNYSKMFHDHIYGGKSNATKRY